MNCSGSSNQRRNCACYLSWPSAEDEKRQAEKQWARQLRMEWVTITIAIILLAAATIQAEYLATGTVYWMPMVWGGMLALVGTAYVLGWVAEKVIDGIDFMTRWED